MHCFTFVHWRKIAKLNDFICFILRLIGIKCGNYKKKRKRERSENDNDTNR